MSNKKQETKAVLFIEPNDNEYKAPNEKSSIVKETFEEKSHYPLKPLAPGAKKNKNSAREDKPLISSKEDDLSGVNSESAYIEIGDEKISHIFFEDGSHYKVGVGFIKNASDDTKKFVEEKLASLKK